MKNGDGGDGGKEKVLIEKQYQKKITIRMSYQVDQESTKRRNWPNKRKREKRTQVISRVAILNSNDREQESRGGGLGGANRMSHMSHRRSESLHSHCNNRWDMN